MMPWDVAHIGFERDGFRLEGVDIWNATWESQPGWRVELSHPAHPHQHHLFDVYEAAGGNGPLRFAATELSPGVYGFYRWRPE